MQQALPFVQVRDLPSSASFYSAITQPLKLRYISANSSAIVFGDTTAPFPEPVLEVRKVGAGQRLKPGRVVLSAQSPSIVSAFRAAALRADPGLPVAGDGERRVEITDFDGNRIEVVCSQAPGYPTSYGGSTAGSMLAPRDPRTMMRRSATTSTVEPPPPESPMGLGAGSGIGTVLGAAAVGVAVGGALTYAFMRNDRQRAPRQEFDSPSATAVQRRASFPDPQPDRRTRYIEDSPRKYPPQAYGARYAQIEAPPRSRALDDVDDRRSSHYGGSSRSRRRSEAGSSRRPLMIADAEYMGSTPSKAGTSQKLLMETEYRSQASEDDDRRSRYTPSKYTTATTPSKHRSRDASRSRAPAPRPVEAETYVSARSKRSASTVRPAPQPEKRSSGRSRASSHVSRATWEDWDDDDNDDAASLAPSDSISCIGDGGHRTRSHRRSSHAGGATGSTVGRYRNVLNEFDGKRRPLYGSEYNY